MIPKSTDIFCDDSGNDLLPYKDSFYQACHPISSTPDRAHRGTRSRWHDISATLDTYPHTMSTPRSLVAPLTPSLSKSNMQTIFSPSPLPVSQVPSLVFPEISPPSHGSGSTPFERQFADDSSREWNNINPQISPVLRNNFHAFSFSPSISNACGISFRTYCGPNSQDSQDPVGRVSLIDKFMSAAADESATTDSGPHFATFQSRDCSPFSDLSELTSLSSSDESERGCGLRRSSPPTSPATEGLGDLKQSNTQYSDQLPNREQTSFPSQSTRNSSRSRDSDYRPAKGTTECKRKRTSQNRDSDEIPIKRKKRRVTDAPEPFSADASSSLGTLTQRRLPTDVPYHPQFSLLYLRYPVSSYMRLADGKFVLFSENRLGDHASLTISPRFPLLSDNVKRPAGCYNEPRDALDLYTPRFVKGCGATKVGLCPICIESPSRGGKGESVWLAMKFSAYKWHVFDNASTSSAHIVI